MPLLGPDGAPIVTVPPVMQAAIQWFASVGAHNFQTSVHQPENGAPAIHVAAVYFLNGTQMFWDTAAGKSRLEASYRLMDALLRRPDSKCNGCQRQCEMSLDVETPFDERVFDIGDPFCLLCFDPAQTLFRRSCDGKS